MARIRTVKPELFRHEELYELEQECNLPIRVAFIGLFTVCDREGRFKWKPRSLKLDILPYDNVDISRVLDALCTGGFLSKYDYRGEIYGCIPSFIDHQVINNRESASRLPSPEESTILTCGVRVDDALRTPLYHAQVERKGREGKGKEGEQEGYSTEPTDSVPAIAKTIMPVLFKLPLNKKDTFHEVTQTDIDEFSELYPAVDVAQEIRGMIGWLKTNHTRRKTQSGIAKFMNTWLAKAQNGGGNTPARSFNKAEANKSAAELAKQSILDSEDYGDE